MKIYVLGVHEDDFEYDNINKVVVLATSEEQAVEFAKKERDVRWEIERIHETTEPKLIFSMRHFG